MRIGARFDAVLAGAKADEPWAYERLWTAYAPPVAAYLRLQGADDADGLTSETFLAAFRKLGTFAGAEAQLQAWLFTIAHRKLLDGARRARVRPQWGEDDGRLGERSGGDAEDDALRHLGEERVRDLCGRLLPAQRDVLLLRVLADLTVEAVAEVLGKTPGAVKALQRRGLAQLRTILEHEAYLSDHSVRLTG